MSPDSMLSVDVVIPLYNHAASINRAVGSVLRQTYTQWNLVIVDDGSTDRWTLESDDARISVIRQANAGPGSARNAGAAAGAAELLAFIDADDEWEPDYLATMVQMMTAHPEAAAACCAWSGAPEPAGHRLRGGEGTVWSRTADERPLRVKERVDLMHTSATIVRRSVFTDCGGFYPRGTWGEDSYLWAAIAFTRPVVFSPRKLLRFHTDFSTLGVGRTSAYPLEPMLTDPDRFLQNVAIVDARFLHRYWMFFARHGVVRSVRQGAARQALRFLVRTRPHRLGLRPWHIVLLVACSFGDLAVAAALLAGRRLRPKTS